VQINAQSWREQFKSTGGVAVLTAQRTPLTITSGKRSSTTVPTVTPNWGPGYEQCSSNSLHTVQAIWEARQRDSLSAGRA